MNSSLGTSTASDPHVTSSDISARTTAEALDIPFVETLEELKPSTAFLDRIPIAVARQHQMLGFVRTEAKQDGGRVTLALSALQSWHAIDLVSRLLRQPVSPLLTTSDEILACINLAYESRGGQADSVIRSLDKAGGKSNGLVSREDLLDMAGRAPVVELVNTILFEAVKANASDLHIQPYESSVVIRFRIDGTLFDSFDLPKHVQDEVVSRVKVIGKMDIAEKRLPQDGRATVTVGDRIIDLRIASQPTNGGERVVIRLLDKSARIYTLGELGMDAVTLGRFRELIGLEHGLILVTGPTGSGKSTTLYSAVQEIDAKDRNVMTLEDPIEYQLDGISQTQINEKKGMTFASGLRSVLRQDPDIIMVGEIRDRDTAVMAIQSALTGHLVFSTLHTNDASSAITRLLDLGIEPYLVSSSVIAVMAQRLVRKTCSQCAKQCPARKEDIATLTRNSIDANIESVWIGEGCENCRQTGYRGRVGLFELLVVEDGIRDKIQTRANAAEIREASTASGMKLLSDDGVSKAIAGKTSLDEVMRVTMRTAG